MKLCTSAGAQRDRLIAALRNRPGGMTTIDIRRELDIIAPAPRIFELRWNEGYNILLTWVQAETLPGHRHRVGRYTLAHGKWRANREAA